MCDIFYSLKGTMTHERKRIGSNNLFFKLRLDASGARATRPQTIKSNGSIENDSGDAPWGDPRRRKSQENAYFWPR